MPKALLFDLDDTLFDHQYARRAALSALVRAYPSIAGHDLRIIEAIHERHLQTTHAHLLEATLSLEESRRERMRLLFLDLGATLPDDKWAAVESVYRSNYNEHRRAVPGAIPLIEGLRKHYRIGIITNGLVIEQEEKIALCGFDKNVHAILISEQIGVKKPAKEFFEFALESLGTSAKDSLVIGDSWKNDVQGAVGAGLRAIWLNRYGEICPDPAQAIEVNALEPVDQLLRLIARE